MSPSPKLSPNARRRGNVWEQREATAELREAAHCFALTTRYDDAWQEVEWFGSDCRVTVHEHVIWPRSLGTLPDPDAIATYCKAALDGIVDAGVIAGDSAKHIAEITVSQEKGQDKAGMTVITIQEQAVQQRMEATR